MKRETIEKFAHIVIAMLFTCMIVFLFAVSIFGNSFVNHDEFTYYVTDNALLHILSFFVIVGCGLAYRRFRRNGLSDRVKKTLWTCMLVVYSVILATIALYVALEPRADQKSIVDTAMAMLDGDYSAFQVGGYMYVYPNQVGIVYFFYWLFRIVPFGYKTVFVLNAISLAIIVWGMNGIGRMLLKNNKSYGTGIVTLLFFPMACYVTFVYGNLIGMALSTLGIYYAWKYLEEKKNIHIVLGVVFTALAVIIKENFLIPMIGIIIFLVFDLIRKPCKKSILFLISLLLVTIGVSNGVRIHMEHITGQEISEGVPTLAWVAMGMQTGYMAYGWHNQYNEDVYRDNNCNTQATNQVVKKEIAERIHKFASNPGYMVKFFYQKTISQWNNPSFEGFWINDPLIRHSERSNDKKLSSVLESIAGEPGNRWINMYCNIYQTMILLGTCAWLLLGRKEIRFNQLLLATIFVGGFIFHFIWEAKCQYVMPYFVLLFPYTVRGWTLLLDRVQGFLEDKEAILVKCKNHKSVLAIIVICIMISLLYVVGKKYIDKAIGFSNNAYEQLVHEKK